MGVSLDVTAVDTLPLAQALLPQLSKHKLDVVADHLGLPSFNHHRATDDASTVAYMLVPFFKRLEEEHGIHSLDPINRWAAERNQKRKGKRRPGISLSWPEIRPVCAISISWYPKPIWNTFNANSTQ